MAVKAAYEVTITDETDILSLVTWYALTASATPPSKPTTTKTSDAVPSPWTTNEPSFDPSQGTKYLYTVIQTRWKDGSCTWDNSVQLSSSYEQAKQAWNKANAAKDAVDGLEIGGRNLLRWTAEPTQTSTSWNRDPASIDSWSRWNTYWNTERTDYGIKGTLVLNGASTASGFVVPLVAENAAIGGVDYVLSFDYRTNASTTGAIYLLCASGGNAQVASRPLVVSETEWQHFSAVLNWSSTEGKVTRGLLIPYFNRDGAWLEIHDGSIKLEKGNKATDWSPAPEDVEQNAKDYADQAASAAVAPLATKTYTGVIGTANDLNNASLYFAKIHPDDYNGTWRIKLRVNVTAPTTYQQVIDFTLSGRQSVYMSYDDVVSRSTAAGAVYYINFYRASQAGITAKAGHALGFGLRSSTNPANASYARTVEVQVLEAVNCEVELLDTAVKYGSLPSYSTTNYGTHATSGTGAAVNEFNVWNNGQNASNNSNTYDRTTYAQNVKASSDTYVGTHIIVGDSSGYRNLAAGKTFDLSYPILYYATAASTTIASGSTANNHYLNIPGISFSVNGTVESGAAYKTLYLKGTISGNIFTIAASPFMTTAEPTNANGYFYIPLGVMSSATAGRFVSSSDLYAFIDGKFRQVTPTEIVATQRVYYRSKASGTFADAYKPTAWVTQSTDKYNANTSTANGWSTKVTPIAASKDADSSGKYLYLYTCEQRKRLDGTVEHTDILLDDSTTVIDGGNIITGSITANQVNFADATGNQLKLFDPSSPTNYQIISSQGNELFANDASVAKFGDVSVVGKKTTEVEDGVAIGHGSYLELDYHSLQLTHERADGSGNQTYFYVSDLRGDDNLAYITFFTIITGEEVTDSVSIPIQITPANQNSADFNTRAGISACYYPDPADPTNWVNMTVSGVTTTTNFVRVRMAEDPPKDTLIAVTYDTSSDYVKAYTAGMRMSGTGIGPMSFTEGLANAARGFAAHAEGWSNQSIGEAAHAEGELSFAIGLASHVEGRVTEAFGEASHAEGRETKAICEYAHAEGEKTEANSAEYSGYEASCGEYGEIFLDGMKRGGSHAEGSYTKALGSTSHSEGMGTRAEGVASHAAGSGTKALGAVSTATGIETIASGRAQTVIGRCNVEDTNNEYALIIGNGEYTDQRSNSVAIRWTGDGTSYNTPGALAVFSKAIDGSVTPSSNIYTRLLSGVAANGEVFGSLGMYRSSDSYNLMQFEVQNAKSDGTFIYNTLKLGVKDDGTRWVGVTDAAVWRNALGLKALAQKASVSFSTTNVSKTSSKGSVAGGASIALSTPVTSPGTGYYATGALGVNSNHNSVCVVNMFDGDTVKVRNTGSSTLSDITATLSFKYGKVTVS